MRYPPVRVWAQEYRLLAVCPANKVTAMNLAIDRDLQGGPETFRLGYTTDPTGDPPATHAVAVTPLTNKHATLVKIRAMAQGNRSVTAWIWPDKRPKYQAHGSIPELESYYSGESNITILTSRPDYQSLLSSAGYYPVQAEM